LPLRLLCVTAHPDDESGGFAGALMTANAAGAETMVLCLTEGTAASNRGVATSNEHLAELRRGEFADACRLLKVTHGEVLTYPDGKLPEYSFQELAAVIVEKIRIWRPQVVLTFGGEGGANLHRDHSMVSVVTTAAFHWAGRAAFFPEQLDTISGGLKTHAPQKLYYQTSPFVVSRNQAEAATAARCPWSLTLDLGEWKDLKVQAFMQHRTQAAILDRVRATYEKYMHAEQFLLAASRVVQGVREDRSLFDGVVED
jgi:LmbE family N-acetylglucosaminyl deacetylase